MRMLSHPSVDSLTLGCYSAGTRMLWRQHSDAKAPSTAFHFMDEQMKQAIKHAIVKNALFCSVNCSKFI